VKEHLSRALLFPFINTKRPFPGPNGASRKARSAKSNTTASSRQPPLPRLQRAAKARLDEGFLQPKVVYGYFPVQSQGNDLIVYHTEEFQQASAPAASTTTKKSSPTARRANICVSPSQDRKAAENSA